MKDNHLLKRMLLSVNLRLLKLPSSWFSIECFAAIAQRLKKKKSLSSMIIPCVDTSPWPVQGNQHTHRKSLIKIYYIERLYGHRKYNGSFYY